MYTLSRALVVDLSDDG